MIYLRFEIAEQIYVLGSDAIVEVIPFLPVNKMAHSSPVLAGTLNYRGNLIPVIDLAMLFSHKPSKQLACTRIVVVNFHRVQDESLLLAFIVEQATETMKFEKGEFTPEVVSNKHIPYSGSAMLSNGELVFCLEVEKIIPHEIASQLYPQQDIHGEPVNHVN
ncbi:chemotaxis protein CheW [Endozoicomonas elysicola]|uniref:chemotaxis protein CheW n=1 Tax=Endozoicomonas elysicola TaxID=305900 RepID=UPI0003710E5F|nr:chemotaxis protein CheW [Endozoicomonas elysicola]